jgi:hypothetical protein
MRHSCQFAILSMRILFFKGSIHAEKIIRRLGGSVKRAEGGGSSKGTAAPASHARLSPRAGHHARPLMACTTRREKNRITEIARGEAADGFGSDGERGREDVKLGSQWQCGDRYGEDWEGQVNTNGWASVGVDCSLLSTSGLSTVFHASSAFLEAVLALPSPLPAVSVGRLPSTRRGRS